MNKDLETELKERNTTVFQLMKTIDEIKSECSMVKQEKETTMNKEKMNDKRLNNDIKSLKAEIHSLNFKCEELDKINKATNEDLKNALEREKRNYMILVSHNIDINNTTNNNDNSKTTLNNEDTTNHENGIFGKMKSLSGLKSLVMNVPDSNTKISKVNVSEKLI
jgi:chromosome segregation ATPase